MLQLDHPRKLAARDFAATIATPNIESFDRTAWEAAASFGVLGLLVAPAFGGAGLSTVDALLTFEGLGLGASDYGLIFALSAQVFSMQTALCAAGRDEQHQEWLPRLISGDAIGSFAMTEPKTGSNTAAIETTATLLSDGRYRLDGVKTWVTLGPVCDVVIVFATVDAKLGRWGLTAFLVPVDTPGVRRGPAIAKIGLRSCPFNEITFENCVVAAEAMLGSRGAGGAIFSAAVNAERAFLYAAQLGASERTMNQAINRAQERTQFGRPIGGFQAVSHRIADMKLKHEMSRLLVYKAGALSDLGKDVTMAASLAKLQVSESAIESAVDTMRIFGAEGFTEAAGIGTALIDAVGGLSYSGTSEIQRNIVASLLGTERESQSSRRSSRENS